VVVWALVLLAMFAYPPLIHTKAAGYGLTKWAYGWLWQDGSIDMARLGIQCFLVSGVAGLLAYVLRPAGIQAIAKTKKLFDLLEVRTIRLAIVSVMGATIVVGGMVLLLHFWNSPPPAQVSNMPTRLLGHNVPVNYDPFVLDSAKLLPEQVSKISVEDPTSSSSWGGKDPLVANQEIRLVVKNGSGEALRAISIRVYYPGVAAPATYDRLVCSDSADGKTEVTIEIEHEYVPPLRVEVLEAWRK
jgi:hypothetical protein